jgi:hypothetical protein
MSNTSGHSCSTITPLFTRRGFLRSISCGFGWLAFSSLLQRAMGAASSLANPLAAKTPPLPAKAKRVIFLTMRGGPSHVDTFDYKPRLTADTGMPGKRPGTKLLGSKWKFNQYGQGGLWISELFPGIAQHADELCLVRSMQTDLPAHPQAFLNLHTGDLRLLRPSLGAWTTYGLGTVNENLPASSPSPRRAILAAHRIMAARSFPRSIRARVSVNLTARSPRRASITFSAPSARTYRKTCSTFRRNSTTRRWNASNMIPTLRA